MVNLRKYTKIQELYKFPFTIYVYPENENISWSSESVKYRLWEDYIMK